MRLQVAVGCDHAGLDLKDEVKKLLDARDLPVVDVGAWSTDSVDYPEFGQLVAGWVAAGEDRMGILLCGTGIGMSMVANRVPGVRAALCCDPWMARMAREHNDANVLCLGARLLGPGLAAATVEAFLDTPFAGGRHARRVEQIKQLDCGKGYGVRDGAAQPDTHC